MKSTKVSSYLLASIIFTYVPSVYAGGIIGNALETLCGGCGAGKQLDRLHSNLGNPLDIPGRVFRESIVESLGPALAAAIQLSRDNARNAGTQPIPENIRSLLEPYFDRGLLNTVRYRVGQGHELSVQANSMRFGDAYGVALIDTVVFRNSSDAHNNYAMWAHELNHIRQYRSWGLLAFAKRYVRDFSGVEEDADRNVGTIMSALVDSGKLPSVYKYNYSRIYNFKLQTPTPLPESDDKFDFEWLPNGNLMVIQKYATGSKKTEVHILSGVSTYQNYVTQTSINLHETDNTIDFVVLPNSDLVVIAKSNTTSSKTEFHILSAESGYQKYSLQVATPLHTTGDETEFVAFKNGDIAAIIKSGTTSNMTEIHIISASSNYSKFSLNVASALHETSDNYEFSTMNNRDILAIAKKNTGSETTEVHRLSASNNYKIFNLQSGTALHETDSNFQFLTNENDDLVAIAKSGTSTGKTEVHILELP